MRKKALLAVMMAMVLLLSGCALIVKDEAVDNATEIIRMGDKVITKGEIKKEVSEELEYRQLIYSAYYGQSYDTSDASNIASVQEDVIDSMKKELTLEAKAKELGLDQLTDEEKEKAKEEAQSNFDSAVSSYKSSLTDTEGMDDEAITKAAADKLLEERGVDLQYYIDYAEKEAVDEKLREEIIKDVAVTDEEIQAEYDSKVEADKASYGENAASWVSAANNGTTLYYTPAGVRRVKQILTKFKEEDQTAIDDAKKQVTEATTARDAAQAKIDTAQETLDAEGDTDELKEAKEKAQADKEAAEKDLEEANAALETANKAVEDATNKAFENIDEDADAILKALDEEGADWQALMEEKNQDPGMSSNPKGYAVCKDMTGFDAAFVDAAMALEKIGDHSGKVKGTSYGYYIIRYDSDEAEGAVALDDVKETISSSLLKTKQNETYNTTVEQWIEAAGIKVDLNALKD